MLDNACGAVFVLRHGTCYGSSLDCFVKTREPTMSDQITSIGVMIHMVQPIFAGNRDLFFIDFLKGKKVLHVGCTDHPVFSPETNLHIKLNKHIEELHGLDIDEEGIEVLRKYVDKKYYTSHTQVDEAYDVVLVPEVMEHVLNAGEFLHDLMTIDTKDILVMVPNAIAIMQNNPDRFGWNRHHGEECYAEMVHADHTAYYSPVTLNTLVEKTLRNYKLDDWIMGPLFLTELSVGCLIRHLPAEK